MISVVIPVLNEEQEIGGAVADLDRQGMSHEVIVVDGGSDDGTIAAAEKAGARVVCAARGRGRQLNVGARAAAGDVLLFLHVDTRLPPGALEDVAGALVDANLIGGGFLKRYDRRGALLGVVEALLNTVRSRIFKALVGTQAMFIRSDVFDEIGGFPEWPFLEDVALSDAMRRRGGVAILRSKVVASARRYRRRGTLRQILVNGLVLAGYRLGFGPARLERLYEGLR